MSKITEGNIFSEADKESFIKTYIVNFIASYTAEKYYEACVTGNQRSLAQPPVEDARFLAEAAWNQWCEVIGLDDEHN